MSQAHAFGEVSQRVSNVNKPNNRVVIVHGAAGVNKRPRLVVASSSRAALAEMSRASCHGAELAAELGGEHNRTGAAQARLFSARMPSNTVGGRAAAYIRAMAAVWCKADSRINARWQCNAIGKPSRKCALKSAD